jgi:5-methylthioadenosine/S-adenosylhomocysteine deaminase
MAVCPKNPTTVDILIHSGVIVPMADVDRILYDGGLAIDQGRIVALASTEELTEQYAGRKTIDACHQAVLPGLINTHHHCLQNFLKGAPDHIPFPDWIDHVSAPRIALAVQDYLVGEHGLQYHATRMGCIEALKSGTTCLLNMEWATSPEIIDVYEALGIRAIHTLTLTDNDEWQKPDMLLPLDMAFDLAEQLRVRCQESSAGRVTFRYGPACENSTTPELLKRVRDLAKQTGAAIHMHIAESKYGWDNIHRRYGQTPVGYLNDLGLLGPDVLGAHLIWLSDEDVQIIKDTGITVSYNPECHMKLALGISPVVKMLAAGIPVSLGTDSPAVNDNMDLFEAARVGAFLQKHSDPTAVPAYQALEMATSGGASALGMADEIGSLEVGKKADVILVDLTGAHLRPVNNIVNNLVYSASAASDVKTVIIDGQIVVEDRELLSCDEAAVLAEAEEFAFRRFEQAGLTRPIYYRTRCWPENGTRQLNPADRGRANVSRNT